MADVAAPAPAKSPAAKKASKPKKVSTHPPYITMVSEAILALKERDGSSIPAIKKWIDAKYGKVSPQPQPASI